MVSTNRLLAIGLFIALIVSVLKEYSLIILGLVVLWFVIRWIADIFWWGKDKGKW